MTRRKTLVGISFLLIGFILLSIPFYDSRKQSKEIQVLEEALELIQEENGLLDSNVRDSDTSRQVSTTFSAEQLRKVIELEIPSIDLKEKVLSETNEENLSIALTQIKQEQVPGEGNFAIAGHRGFLTKHYFLKLPDVEQGDEIILHAKNKKYVYRVIRQKVVEPTEVEIVNDRKGKEEITLITCTTDGRKRIAVTGELAYIVEGDSN